MEEFKFYYTRLEVPVARLKAMLLRELKLRVDVVESGRAKNYDGESDSDSEDEDDENGEDNNVLVHGQTQPDEPEEDQKGKKVTCAGEENEQQEEEEETPPLIGWKRYKDENGWPYFYNHNTQESTYDNPFIHSDSESDDDSEDDEESFEERRRKEQARLFMEFCAIMVQARVRGVLERKRTRHLLAKRFRKVINDDSNGEYVYEDLQTHEDASRYKAKRPSLFNFVFPQGTNF